MPKLPVTKPREAIKALQKVGFAIHHVRGSHYILKKQSLRVTIPYHTKPLKRKTFVSILKQAGLSVEEFMKLR